MSDEQNEEKTAFPLNLNGFKYFPRETAHLLISAMMDGVTVVGPDYRILDCNEAILRLHGVSRGEYVGKSVYDFIVPEDQQRASRGVSDLSKRKHVRVEVRALKKDGGTFDAEIYVSLLKDSSGKPLAVLGVTRDITEWNKRKEAIRESEEKFRNIFENATDCMINLDKSGRILDINRKAVEVFGGTEKELLDKHFAKAGVFSLRDTPLLMSAFMKILAGEKVFLDLCIKNKKDQEIALECSGSLTKTGDEQAVLIVARDITKRMRAEEALRESEQKFRCLVEDAAAGICIIDLKGRFSYVNKPFADLLGYSVQEFASRSFKDFLHPDDVGRIMRLFLRIILLRRQPRNVEFRAIHKDGHVLHLMTKPTRFIVNGKTVGFQAIIVDMTERKKATEALQESEERYRELTGSISDVFFAMDKNLRYTYWNKASEKLTGISAKYAIGKSLTELFPDNKGTRTAKQTYLETIRTQRPHSLIINYPLGEKDFVFEINAYPSKDGISVFVKDITERKKIEEALRKSEEQARHLSEFQNKVIDTANVWIDLLDAEGNVTLWNWAAELISGYSREEVVGHKKIWEWLYPDSKYRTEIFAQAKKIIKKGEHVENYQTTIKCKDGTLKIISWYSNNIADENGKPVGSIAVGLDITEIKKVQEKIRESEEKYRNIFENARDLIVTIDLEGNITSANNVLLQYGYDKDELVGRNVFKVFPQEEWQQQFRAFLREMTHGKPIEGEFRIKSRLKQGYTVVEFKSNPIINDNKIVGAQIIARDITERKEMEEKLKQYSERLEELVQKRTEELLESEKRYSVLVEEASDGVAIAQEGKMVFANRRAAEIFGYPTNELIGLPIEKTVDEKYRQLVMERYARRLRGEKVPTTYEIELVTKNGERKPIELSATRINYQGHSANLLIVYDISERKRMEDQRLRLERLATMGELATMVAHDLRNPLTSIRNASFYVRNTCPRKADLECKSSLEMLDIIEKETIFANNIINDLLDFTAKRPLQKRRKNISSVIGDSLAGSNIPENVEVERNLAEKAVATVDEKQLQRVFSNLIKNATQAMPDGGKLAVTTKETKDNVEIMFADTGVGISEENISKLFTPLFTTKAKGIGLGLAICKNIVEQHHGTIKVKSKAGQGTTFTIKLPKREEARNQ